MRVQLRAWGAVALSVLALPATGLAQGLYLPGSGAAHISMGGASTATPVDALGALYWNPAAIGRLGRSEVDIGGAFLFPNIHLDSSVPGPGGLRSGNTRSDNGVSPATGVGAVIQPDCSPWTFGLGMATLAGSGVNFPGDTGNPILSGVGPLGNVQGPIFSSLMVVQLSPTVAYRATDRLVVGVGPTIDIAVTAFDPAFFGTPDRGRGDGIGTFPTATHGRPFWGGGFRAGLVYSLTDQLDFGFGYTSPQWFETWKYYARTDLGQPRTLTLNATLPAIYSWGVGYRPTDRLQLAVDLRYFAYQNTELFGTPIRDGGLGWQDVFAVAVGGRYQATDRVALSAGYIYNDNPIPSFGTLFNVQGPAITQHTISFGATVNVTEAVAASLGYAYAFRNSISGPVREATGVGVKMDAEAQLLTFTLQFKFGGAGTRPTLAKPADGEYVPAAAPAPIAVVPGPAA
jgi:long-chain fatty acid transport protein